MSREWQEVYEKEQIEEWLKQFENPAEFQLDLKNILNEYSNSHPKVIEIGCGIGITSLILSDKFERTLLDNNPKVIELAKEIAVIKNKNCNFILADMFKLPFGNNEFDLVFNSGVIEHFNFLDRVRLLKEYARILNKEGIMIIAFPNHYSPPYRTAYVVKKKLLAGKDWPYPEEYKLYDLKAEIKAAGLKLLERRVVAKAMTFEFVEQWGWAKKLFKWWNYVKLIEGYLTVLKISKL